MRYLAITLILLLTACADAKPTEGTALVGFWSGLWHGLIIPWAFVWSVFDSSCTLYASYNNGFWYNFGYAAAVTTLYMTL